MTPTNPAVAARTMCIVCALVPPAMSKVDYCFGCWPGGPVTPPPCLRCGSTVDYYTSGRCLRCHRGARPGVDSCVDCLAWGATRHTKWLCKGCVGWRQDNPTIAPCPTCSRTLTLGRHGFCRLCRKQANFGRGENRDHAVLDVAEANRLGQQLFLADLFSARLRSRPETPPRPSADAAPRPVPPRVTFPALSAQPAPQQLVLFRARRDLSARGRRDLPAPPDPRLAAALRERVEDRGRRCGWSPATIRKTRYAVHLLLALQDDPGGPIHATDAAVLTTVELPMRTTLEVLAEAGLLVDDRPPAIATWFAAKIAALPAPMTDELRIWFDVMIHGSTTAPRRRPRSEVSIRLHLHWTLATLTAWAASGHHSLREITAAHVHAALPASGNPRATLGQGLRSIFRILRARKVVFVDPTARIRLGWAEARIPLPLDPAAISAALDPADPTRAVLVALIAFHGLSAARLRELHLTDVRDGRLHLGDRSFPLADPVRQRLAAYLDHRAVQWPNTANPHLFVTMRSAIREQPVGYRWLRLIIGAGLTTRSLREDRILDEVQATDGDARRLHDLFGLSIQATARYTATLDNPDLISPDTHRRTSRSATDAPE